MTEHTAPLTEDSLARALEGHLLTDMTLRVAPPLHFVAYRILGTQEGVTVDASLDEGTWILE